MKLLLYILIIVLGSVMIYRIIEDRKPTLTDKIYEQFQLIDTIDKDIVKSIVKVSNLAIDMAYLNLAFIEEINKLSTISDRKTVAKEKLDSLILLDDLNDKALRE